MPNIFLYHLARLLSFTGRENRKMFWPWAILVAVIYAILFFIIAIASGFVSMTAVSPTVEFESVFAPFAWTHMGLSLLAALLLMSAAARRLHDANRSALWGAIPFLLFVAGAVGTPLLLTPPAMVPDMNVNAVGLLTVNNLLYLASIVVLAVLLSRPGTKGDNRFGPQPDATPIISFTQDV